MSLITIYHTTDIHNHRGVFKFFDTIKKDKKTLFLDSGDALAGSNTAFRLTEPVLKDMNRVGYDAIAMGNREFSYIREIIKLRIREAAFPILCANVVDLKGVVDKYIVPYIIKEIDGVKIGIFGLTPVQYDDKSFWLNIFKFMFIEPVEASNKIMKELQEKADLIILLSHLGIDKDKEIAKKVDGIDLILGGHSHTLLKKPIVIEGTHIFNGGSHGKYVGRIKFFSSPENGIPVANLQYKLFPAGIKGEK